MDLQTFKYGLEIRFSWKELTFKLLEFHYHGYVFGSGILVYQIKGYNYKLIYDGRDDLISIERSGKHEKYPECKWVKLDDFKNLNDDIIKKTIQILAN